MSKETREHISSLMDGEISRETSRFLVRRLGADEELCATWARYHLVRDCLRHQDGDLVDADLCKRIGRALEDEAPKKASPGLSRAWLKSVSGLAIAASVAMMAIIMVGPNDPAAPQSAGQLAEMEQAESFTSPQSYTRAPVSQQASLSGQQAGKHRLQSYLLRHYQATGSTGGKGFVAFVPIVSTSAATPSGDAERNTDQERDSEANDQPSKQ